MKQNKNHLLIALLSMGIAMSSCVDEHIKPMDTLHSMQVKVNKNLPQSRAIITETTFPDDSRIGVTLLNTAGNEYDGVEYSNLQYAFDGTDWNVVEPHKVPLLSSTAGKAIAYYPYGETVDYTAMTIETDTQIDYLYSNWETVNNARPEANFTMNHALSAIRVILKKKDSYAAKAVATNIMAKSTAFVESAKINAGAAENKYSEWSTGEADVTVPVVTKVPDATGGQILDNTTDNFTDIVVVPAEAAGTSVVFTVTIEDENGQALNYTVDTEFTTAMAPGNIYQFTLTLDATGFSTSSVFIIPWGDPVPSGKGDETLVPAN